MRMRMTAGTGLLTLVPLLLCAALLATAAHVQEASAAPNGRLPEGVRPLHYRLDLTIDPRKERFGGTAAIRLELDDASDGFWMHGNNLDVQEISVTPQGGEPVAATYEQVQDSGVVRIDFAETVPAGEATLKIVYDAPFDPALSGMFRVKEGEAWYSLVKSESIQARKAFPGFDEPRFKTPFDVTLTIPEGDVAIGNSPAAARAPAGDGRLRVRFGTTRPLPTYLVSLAVGPFEEYEIADLPPNGIRDHTVPLSGWARQGKAAEMAAIMQLTRSFIETYERVTGIPYPYSKLDVIAAPDWPSGATELAGAPSYREDIILSAGEPSPRQQRRIVGIHAHELAHMWVGDYVTPPWWDDLWLKEAFADWAAPIAASARFPDAGYELDAQRAAIEGMSADSLASARPVRQRIESNDDIRNAYDAITYSKGAAVLNMTEAYLGKEKWRNGLNRYFNEFADGVADSRDFFRVMAAAAGDPDFEESLKGFIERPGLPLLEAELICGGAESPRVTVRQRRYAPLGSSIDPAMQWIVPVCIAHGGDAGRGRTCALVREANAEIPLPAGACPAWIMPNAGGDGYYRFALPAAQWTALIDHFGELGPAEALMAVDSIGAAFEAGNVHADLLLDAIEAAAASRHPAVAGAPLDVLARYVAALTKEGSQARADARAFAARLYRDRYDALRDAQGEEERVLRQQLQDFLALAAGDEALRLRLADAAAAFIGQDGDPDPQALTADEYDAAARVAVEDLGPSFVSAFLEARDAIDVPAFESGAMYALGWSDDPKTAARLRDVALADGTEPSDAFRILSAQMENDETRDAAWNWLRERPEAVSKKVPSQYRRRVPGLAGAFCDTGRIAEVDAFAEKEAALFPGYERGLAQAKETIALCQAFREAKTKEFTAELSSRRAD
ncbi:MAG TPA: M1 family metallopeptidase [Woeseiaceae bacterium]